MGRLIGRRFYPVGLAAFACLLCVTAMEARAEKSASWHREAGIGAYLEGDAELPEIGAKKALGETETETGEGAPQTGTEEETEKLVMADVQNVLNVRVEPDSDAALAGYLYADCGGTVLEQRDGWTKLVSGELTGWAKDEYLLFGEEARREAADAGRTVATTTAGALRIRKEPSEKAGVYDLLEEGARCEVIDDAQSEHSGGGKIPEGWVAVDYGGKTGYVSAKYVKVSFEIDSGETVEQVAAREAEEQERREAEALEAEKAAAAAKEETLRREAEKAVALAADDSVLLAALIQCEAGDEPYEGQLAVGAVVMNRVKSGAYPNTVKDVIYASGQFTPAGSGRVGRVIASGSVKASCLQAAREAMAGSTPVGTATHFRRAGSRDGIVIGNHVFW
ncbi:MAG: cell wall hydrolase [Eubacteriales bacterium]|nr:cell wall hydrolase [Eubacteriales bacterium]